MAAKRHPKLTPEQRQETTQRLIHDTELLRNGAAINALGHLTLTAEQYDELQTGMLADQLLNRINNIVPTPPPSPDARRAAREAAAEQAEKLRDMVDHSAIVAVTWIKLGTIPRKSSAYTELHTPTIQPETAYNYSQVRTNKNAYEDLNQRGVSEIVTFTHVNDSRLRPILPGHANEPSGPIMVMTYEMTHLNRLSSPDHNKFPMGAENMAPGADLYFHMFMEPERAYELATMAMDDPQVIHDLTETIMVDKFNADPDQWEEWGPQYEDWKTADGVGRMAIRHDFNAPADTSQIFDY